MTGILLGYDISDNKTKIFAFLELTSQRKRQGMKNNQNECVNCMAYEKLVNFDEHIYDLCI